MAYRVEVDKDVCISSGKCVADAPGFFRFDADELSEVVADPPELADAQLEAIARGCPSGAITLFNGDVPVRVA